MIDDLDEALRQLFIRELPIRNGEIDINFDQPKREWAARLTRPTLNIFLHDLRENPKLRSSSPGYSVQYNENGTATRIRDPFRVDLHYMVTAWANEPEDEHRMLTRVMMALFRAPSLPEELLPMSLQNQPSPVWIRTAQEDILPKPSDIWGVLDNEMRPAITCVVTIALNPYAPITDPIVKSREMRVGIVEGDASDNELQKGGEGRLYRDEDNWEVEGTLRSDRPLSELSMKIAERDIEVPLRADGSFNAGHLKAGEYTLEISSGGRTMSKLKLVVPSDQYDFQV